MEQASIIIGQGVHERLPFYWSYPTSHPCVEKENGKTPSEEKSLWRRCWEIYHGISGAIAIAIGLGQVSL